MKLLKSRTMVALVAGAFLLGAGAIGVAIVSAFLASFEELDRRDLRDDAERVYRSFQDRYSVLESKVGDWGAWDEAFNYVTKRDQTFANANFTETVIGGLKITAVVYLDPNLKFISAKEINPGKGIMDIPFDVLNFISPESPLIQKSSGSEPTSGLVNFRGKPAIAAAHIVSRGDGSGPPTGRVIFLRVIDDEMIANLSAQSLFKVSLVKSVEADEANTDAGASLGEIKINNGAIEIYSNVAVAYLALDSVTNERLSHLKVTIPRDIYVFGLASANKVALIYAFLVLAFAVAGYLILRNSGIRKSFDEMMHAHTELAKKEAYLRALLDSVPGSVSWFDRSLCYLGVNGRLADEYGLKPQDFVGKPIGFRSQKSNPDLRVELEKFFAEPEMSKQTTIMVGQNNEQKRFMLFMEKYDGGNGVVCVGIDTTKAWRAEQQAVRDRQIVISSSRLSALGEMAGGIAHEINNPLAIIQGACRKLGRVLKQIGEPEAGMETLALIDTTCARVAKIVNGLRSFARDGSTDPMTPHSVKSLIEQVEGMCSERMRNHGVDFQRANVDPSMVVACREVQIGQVLVNLLNNAFDAIQALNTKWIKMSVKIADGKVDISVTDSGGGIPESVRERMMDPFFTTKPVGLGTGLGLSISVGIIREHGGELFYDETNPNTSFVVRLPLYKKPS